MQTFGHDPVRLMSYACVAQLALILVQFHNLVMATDWQHIFTLVMLMFANYVYFFRYLKEHVVVSHVYADSRRQPDDKPYPLHGMVY